MKQDTLDSIMNKCKSHKPLTIDEYDKLGKTLNLLYGDLNNADDFDMVIDYPMNFIYAIFGEHKQVAINDEKSVKEVESNIDYILCNLMEAREANVLRMRFKGKLSLDEVAKILDLTRERVRQIEARALRKMRHPSRAKAIFAPYRLSQEIKERTEVLDKKNLELAGLITKCLDQIDTLSKALDSVGIKVSTEKPNTYVTTLARNINEFEFSVRAYNCMKRVGINTIGDLTEKTEEEMRQVRNLGRLGLQEIKDKLTSLGLKFMTEEERKEHPIHTRAEIKNICENCDYDYHGECRNEFVWCDSCENGCVNYRNMNECDVDDDDEPNLYLCESCSAFKGKNKKCTAGHLCNVELEGCKDYVQHPYY